VEKNRSDRKFIRYQEQRYQIVDTSVVPKLVATVEIVDQQLN